MPLDNYHVHNNNNNNNPQKIVYPKKKIQKGRWLIKPIIKINKKFP